MSGRRSRQKGARGEREAAGELGAVLGIEGRRGCQFAGGPDSPDVALPGSAIHVEAKRVEALQLYAALEQATADAPAHAVPIVWHRRNNKPSVVIVQTDRLADLAAEVVRCRAAAGMDRAGLPLPPLEGNA